MKRKDSVIDVVILLCIAPIVVFILYQIFHWLAAFFPNLLAATLVLGPLFSAAICLTLFRGELGAVWAKSKGETSRLRSEITALEEARARAFREVSER